MKGKLFIKLNRRIKRFLLNLATKYIRHCAKDSNYIKYALSEFKIAYDDWEKEEMQNLMCNQILDLLALLSTQGDSGFSISYKLPLLNKLIKFTPIKKLTFDYDEFNEPYDLEGTRQNKRDSRYFLDRNQKICFLNSYIKNIKYYIGEDLKIKKGSLNSYTGALYVINEHSNIPVQYKVYVKNKKYPNNTINLNCYEIEYPNDWFLIVCSTKELNKLCKNYEVVMVDKDSNVQNELNFRNGEFRDKIIKRIDIVRKHMYAKS